MRLISIVIISLVASALGSSDQLLKPVKSSAQELALILFQGAQIGADQYVALASAIQKASQYKLWVSIPAALLDVQNPVTISSAVSSAKQQLAAAGYSGKSFVVAGHSLGGVSIQDYVNSNPSGIIAQILMGSALQRKYRGQNYPVPTLVLSGELDGLFRVTRMAEEYYNSITLSKDSFQSAAVTFPVVMIQGMNHFQWASGQVPLLVQSRDLKAEVDENSARASGASVIANFIASTVYGDRTAAANLVSSVQATGKWLAPIIKAYEYEGSRQFNAPHQKGGTLEDCPKGGCSGVGSAWAVVAQRYISQDSVFASKGLVLNVTNEFVQLSALPPLGEFHLPDISVDPVRSNQRDLPTYSQCSWELLDKIDTGFVSTSALEIGTKMISRQCSYIRGAGYAEKDAPFTLDDPDFCAEINKMAYDWAVANAGDATRQRFNSLGQKYVFGKDVSKSGGPFWIDATLAFNSKTVGNENVIEVVSPMIKTSFDFPKVPGLPDPSCYHYCKLLSPARATEWIYVDSLRMNAGLSASL